MNVMRGVTFGFYARNGVLGSDWAKNEVDKMIETGVEWVVLCPTVMQDTAHSTMQYRDFCVTPNDHELYTIIDYMHKKGLKVQLRPMLETQDGCGRLSVWFQPDRERIPGRSSRHWQNWFTSMRLRSIHYARIAEDTSAEMYGLDSELDRTVIEHTEEWKEVIHEVRKVYHGPVTSCHTTHCGLIDYSKVLSDKSHWWYDLDLLSLSSYHSGADKPEATVDEMVSFLLPELDKFRKIADEYGKPICFGECGCTSSYGGAMCPSGWSAEGGYRPDEQANYLEALLSLFWKEPWWHGMFWWKWDEQNDRPNFKNDPAGDKGFTLYGKPAAVVLKKWFSRKDHE